MAKVIKLELKEKEVEKIKVAAYCRVSTNMEEQESSLTAQISYYNKLIGSNPEWEFVKIFYDQGISGRTAKRPGFQEMIEMCRNGEIDLILTKSISRFARNTVDLLEYVRELNKLDIEVRFERENISTKAADGELLLTLLAAFAQSESESTSENLRWAAKKDFKEGKSHCTSCYGYKWVDKQPVIYEPEAQVVRKIFDLYVAGLGPQAIAEELQKDGVKQRNGKIAGVDFVNRVLTKEKYSGDEILQKYYMMPGKKGSRKNRGAIEQFLVKDNFPAIITREVYEEACRIRASGEKVHHFDPPRKYALSKKLYCSECGASFDVCHSRTRFENRAWVCSNRNRRKVDKCKAPRITESTAKELICKQMGMPEFDEKRFKKKVFKVMVKDGNRVEIIYK